MLHHLIVHIKIKPMTVIQQEFDEFSSNSFQLTLAHVAKPQIQTHRFYCRIVTG